MRIVLSALLVISVVGCGNKKEAPSTTSETKPVEAKAPAGPKLNGSPVDTCAFLTKDQIKTVFGADVADRSG